MARNIKRNLNSNYLDVDPCNLQWNFWASTVDEPVAQHYQHSNPAMKGVGACIRLYYQSASLALMPLSHNRQIKNSGDSCWTLHYRLRKTSSGSSHVRVFPMEHSISDMLVSLSLLEGRRSESLSGCCCKRWLCLKL